MHHNDNHYDEREYKRDDDGEEEENEAPMNGISIYPLNEFGCTESQRPSPLPWNAMARLGPETVGTDFTNPYSDTTSDIRAELTLVSGGRGCFVQVSPSVLDEAAHVLESWRKNPVRAENTTAILRQLGVVPSTWFLDHLAQSTRPFYGLWSWTLTLNSIARLMMALKKERAARQVMYDETGKAPWRKWDPAWVNIIEFDMVVFRPWLAPNRPLIREDPSRNTFIFIYGPQEGDFRQDRSDGPPVLPFRIPRPPGSELNPFLVALSCLHKLQVHLKRRAVHHLSLETSPHLALYCASHKLSLEIWAPLIRNVPSPTQTVPTTDPGRRSRRVKPINSNNVFSNLGEGGSVRFGEGGDQERSQGGQGRSQGGMGSQEQQHLNPVATDTSAVSLDVAAGSPENDPSVHVVHPDVDEPDPSPLDALERMTAEERVVFGSDLFFKPLLPWGDDRPEN
ncbi:hypothetical protein DFH09DRAFT_1070840 [Mycena vulgaris]|nr:hypothetical protein DFH09DRAFT_1070840 [Mycena vulgaris]